MQTRRQARRKAWQAAAVTDYSQRDWEVGSLLAESRSLLHETPDRLNNVVTCGRDIAALACVNRAFNKVAAQQLWPQLAQKCEADKAWAGLDGHGEWWCNCALRVWRGIKTVPLNESAPWTTMKIGRKTRPAAVPKHVFQELLASSEWGVTEKDAKQQFRLSEKELQELPCTEKELPKRGEQRRFSLVSAAVAARAKHGTEAAMQAATAAKADKIKAGRDAAAERRRQQLEMGLLKLGARLTQRLRRVWLVKGYIKGGCREPGAVKTADEALALARLAAWALKHTGLKQIRRRLLASEQRFDDLWAKWEAAYKASGYNFHLFPESMCYRSPLKHRLSSQDERECLNLAVQRWAAVRGGSSAALRRRSVPSRGVLRDAIISALNAQVDAKIAAWVPAGVSASGGGAAAAQQSDEELTDNELQAAAEDEGDSSSDDSDDNWNGEAGHWEGFGNLWW